jgi:hypothetical protein
MISSTISGDQKVLRARKRPKETSSKAKTAWKLFAKGEAIKELLIPAIVDRYNYNMGVVDEFDYLTA